MRFFVVSTIILISLCTSLHAKSIEADSIGMEKIDGKVYVLHQVEQKETLYSLSKRYGVTIASITAVNPDAENGLSIGQILRVPAKAILPKDDGRIVHTVKPKETLYSIARDYEVDVEDIKDWNKMSLNMLDIGQKIILYPDGKKNFSEDVPERNTEEVVDVTRHKVVAGETLYSLAKKYNTSLEDLRDWNKLDYNDISIGQELIVSRSSKEVSPQIVAPTDPLPTDETESSQDDLPVKTGENSSVQRPDSSSQNAQTVNYNLEEDKPFDRENTNYEEVEEDGLAQLIDGSGNNRKYLALHRTAAIGTIMRVRNEMNGQEVFVRIIGRLPDTGTNRNVLIKISKAAYEQLGAIDNRFRVRISYIP